MDGCIDSADSSIGFAVHATLNITFVAHFVKPVESVSLTVFILHLTAVTTWMAE